jgi:cadmium resistance protein CadD (predicted permease)
MVTTGSKFFYGLAGVGLLAAVVYGIITNGVDQGGVVSLLTGDGAVDALLGPLTVGYKGGVGDHLGYSVLLGFSVASFGLGLATSFLRDGDPEALAELEGSDTAPAIAAPAGLSFWPVVMAFAAALAMVGLAVGPALFVVGCVIAVIAGAEWAVQTWSETATGDPEVNRTIRRRLMHPLEIPIGGAIGIGVVIFCLSRVFLATAGVGAMVVALALAAVVLVGAQILSLQPQVRRGAAVWSVVLFAIAVVALGVSGAIAGTSGHEEHPPPAAEQIETGAPAQPGTSAAVLGEAE